MAIWSTGGLVQGITGKVGSRPRVHATAQDWANAAPITDFWFSAANKDIITAAIPSLLAAQYGWISNGTLSVVAGSGADFLSSSDRGTPTHLLMDTTGERLTSPFTFGGDFKTRQIRSQLGWAPTKLVAEVVAIFTTASNADTTGGFGFIEAGGAVQTAADHLAMITSDGTNFILRSGAATTTYALAVDTSAHIWTITLDLGTQLVTFKQDGTSVGTGGSSGTGAIALETDLFPAAFGMAVTSSNVLGVGETHIYYDN